MDYHVQYVDQSGKEQHVPGGLQEMAAISKKKHM